MFRYTYFDLTDSDHGVVFFRGFFFFRVFFSSWYETFLCEEGGAYREGGGQYGVVVGWRCREMEGKEYGVEGLRRKRFKLDLWQTIHEHTIEPQLSAKFLFVSFPVSSVCDISATQVFIKT